MKKLLSLLLALVATVATFAVAVPPASAAGNRSLAAALTSDGNRFDRNSSDFDLVTEAVLAVLAAKPGSKVGVLTDGSVRATAFIPTDQAFRRLAYDLTGSWIRNEKKLFNALVKLVGVDTIEAVLLYHVVPGATLGSAKVLKSDGARLETALGKHVRVEVRSKQKAWIRLIDADRNDWNPRVLRVKLDINKGNKQIAHGINRVLRPVDL